MSGIAQAPVFKLDREQLEARTVIDFCDYGFTIASGTREMFDIVPTILSQEQGFLFFFPQADVRAGRWSLLNLHIFTAYQGSLEEFAHSRGESVRSIPLDPVTAFGLPAIGYDRVITIAELFKGGENVIDFIGADPVWTVRDSHYYFQNGTHYCYSGLLHPAEADPLAYELIRETLFKGIDFQKD